MSDFKKLLKRLGIRRKYIFLLLLRSPFDALRTWMLAGLLKSVFACIETHNSGKLSEICVVYGLICAMLFLYNGTIWSYYAAFSAKTEVRLQKEMLEKILSMPLKRVDRDLSGEWITKLNSDIQAAITMMNAPQNIPHLVVSVINTMLSSFLMFRTSLFLTGVTWIFLLPQLLINYKIVLKPISRLKEESQKAMSDNTSSIKPLITDADTIMLYDAGGLMMKECDETSRRLMKINMKMHVRMAVSDVVMRLFGIGGYLIILLIGFSLINDGKIMFPDVVYCFQVRGSVLAGMLMIVTCLNNIKVNSVCIKRINDTLEE